MDRQKAIAELRQVAKQNGLHIRFRDVPNEQGDFYTYLHSFEAENAALKLRKQYARVNVLHIDNNDKVTVIRKYEND